MGVAPSASANNSRSPRAASIPVRTAAPLPRFSACWQQWSCGHPGSKPCRTSASPSRLPSSTTRTSYSSPNCDAQCARIASRYGGKRRASLYAGMTKDRAAGMARLSGVTGDRSKPPEARLKPEAQVQEGVPLACASGYIGTRIIQEKSGPVTCLFRRDPSHRERCS